MCCSYRHLLQQDLMMDNNTHATTELKIIQTPSLEQIQTVTTWLENSQVENPNLELELNDLLEHRIIPHKRGGFVAIAHTSSLTNFLDFNNIQGVVMMKPGNTNLLIESCNYDTAKSLLTIATTRGCPQKVSTSFQVKNWIRPLLLQQYSWEREYEQYVMVCSQTPFGGEGQWAIPQDKKALQAYAEAYLAERGTGSLNHPWDDWIQKRSTAVLEYENQIVSVVRYITTGRDALVIAPFTFPEFRRQGFARKILAFLVGELLQVYSRVRLWVDEDNIGAIGLYKSLGFQVIDKCYSGYWK
jgi:GNAT superfamily N-acetyltransferase